MLKRLLAILTAVFTAILLFGGPAQAAPPNGNPHFIGNLTSASLSGSDVVVKFKEAGLPAGSTVTIVASADLTATYQCINKGGHNPTDPKKTTIQTPVSTSGEFTVGKNGTVSGTLIVSAPAASSVLSCPSGQTATLTEWSYTNVKVTDEDSGASITIDGTFSGGARVVR